MLDDTTPPPDDTTTPPPLLADYARTLSLRYAAKKDKFKGKLATTEPACIASEKTELLDSLTLA